MADQWLGCRACKHYNRGKCSAFPGGIPLSIASGDAEHRQVIPGQTGTAVYELKGTK